MNDVFTLHIVPYFAVHVLASVAFQINLQIFRSELAVIGLSKMGN